MRETGTKIRNEGNKWKQRVSTASGTVTGDDAHEERSCWGRSWQKPHNVLAYTPILSGRNHSSDEYLTGRRGNKGSQESILWRGGADRMLK